jgi:hypothetical protein
MQTGLLAGTWFSGRQSGRQALGLQADRAAGRHLHCMQTGLLAGTCTACRQGYRQAFGVQADRQGVTKACDMAGKEWQTEGLQAGTVVGQQADRSAGMPAHRLWGQGGRKALGFAGRQTGRQAHELQLGTVADGRQI